MLDEKGLPLNLSKSYLSEEQRLKIVRKKIKLAKVSIVTGILSCFAFLVVLICAVLAFKNNIDLPFEPIFFLMLFVMVIASVIGGVCSTKAKSKVNREQVLEGKSLKCVRLGVVLSYVSVVLCVMCVKFYLSLVFSLIYLGGYFWSII